MKSTEVQRVRKKHLCFSSYIVLLLQSLKPDSHHERCDFAEYVCDERFLQCIIFSDEMMLHIFERVH